MHQEPLELIYYATGIASVFMAVLIAYIFATNDANYVKSRIFLKYSTFKLGFFALIAAIAIFAVTNFMMIFDFEIFHNFHEFGEIVYNAGIIFFIVSVYIIINPWRKKWRR